MYTKIGKLIFSDFYSSFIKILIHVFKVSKHSIAILVDKGKILKKIEKIGLLSGKKDKFPFPVTTQCTVIIKRRSC